MEDINVQVYNQPEKTKNKFSLPKIIFIVLGIVVLAEVVYMVKVLTTPTASPAPFLQVAKTTTQKSVGKISLTSSKTSLNVGEALPISVLVDTGSQAVSGADLIIRFDPKLLEVTSKDLIKGKVFDDYPLISADAKTGVISISGISNGKDGFKGAGQFATLNLRAKAVGKTFLTIDFQKSSTKDSTLVEMRTAKNILELVDNLEINIQ